MTHLDASRRPRVVLEPPSIPPATRPYPEPVAHLLPAETARSTMIDALRFSLSWHRTELEQVLIAHRWRREVVLFLGFGALTAVLILSVLLWFHVPLHTVILAALASSLVVFLAMSSTSMCVELLGWYRAPWHAWHTGNHSAAGAYIRCHKGGWTITAVHAHPQGRGLGARVMDEATAWADEHQRTLHLTASDQDAVRFYQRHGFSLDTPGKLAMSRHPAMDKNDSLLS